MRPRILYIIIYMLLSLSLSAQKLEFHGESLAAALETLRDVQSGYSINFIVNDLEQLPVHAQLHGLSVPDAVRRLCKGQPVKLKIKGKQIYVTYNAKHKMQTLTCTEASRMPAPTTTCWAPPWNCWLRTVRPSTR